MIASITQTPDIFNFVLFEKMGYIKLKYNTGQGHRPWIKGIQTETNGSEQYKI